MFFVFLFFVSRYYDDNLAHLDAAYGVKQQQQ